VEVRPWRFSDEQELIPTVLAAQKTLSLR